MKRSAKGEKKIKTLIPIGNNNLANKLYSLLAYTKNTINILFGKGINKIRGTINLRYINVQEESFIRRNSRRFLEPFRDLRNLKNYYLWSQLPFKEI
jgi:hypothetical protein